MKDVFLGEMLNTSLLSQGAGTRVSKIMPSFLPTHTSATPGPSVSGRGWQGPENQARAVILCICLCPSAYVFALRLPRLPSMVGVWLTWHGVRPALLFHTGTQQWPTPVPLPPRAGYSLPNMVGSLRAQHRDKKAWGGTWRKPSPWPHEKQNPREPHLLAPFASWVGGGLPSILACRQTRWRICAPLLSHAEAWG